MGATLTGGGPLGTTTLAVVTPSAASAVLAANGSRTGYKVYNDSNVDVLITENSSGASATSYTYRLGAGSGFYETGGGAVYTGAIYCIGVVGTTPTAATSGALRLTEMF